MQIRQPPTLMAFLLIWSFACALIAAEASPSRPNIVLILVDDMGYGDPGCFNPQSKIRTPNIDQTAAEGMRFTDAHASGPLCHMSRYGLMTGRYPFRTAVGRWPKHALIDPGQTTLASLLKRQGYHTAMVGKWHLGFEENGYENPLPGGPVDVGFDSFYGIRASTDIPPYFYIRDDHAVQPPSLPIEARDSPGWSPIQGAFWRAGLIAPDMQLQDVLPRFTDEAISVIEQHARDARPTAESEPLFLYLAYPAPHTPWLPTAEYAGQSQVGLYGDFTEMVDAMIGRVLSSLNEAGMSENTLLIISSDNGPVWYDHDVERFAHDSAGSLRGMKADAWEAGHRMPFICRWPSVIAAGSSSEQTICFTDIMATLANITGYQMSDTEGPDSFDFSPVLYGTALADGQQLRQGLVIESGSGLMTLRENEWKLIDGLGSGGFSEPKRVKPVEGGPQVQLYNLRSDLAESENLAKQHPEIAQRLRTKLQAIRDAPSHRGL